MTGPEEPPIGGRPGRGRAIPWGALSRFLLLGLIVVAGLAAIRWTPLGQYFERETLAANLLALRQSWWAPLALVGLYLVASPLGVPATPLVFAGGVVFGVLWGWLYNFLGAMLGATASYLLAWWLGRDLVVHLAGERLLQRAEALLAKHGFWALVRIRFVPIPFVVINFGAALAGIRLAPFFLSSAFGLAPTLMIYTYFGHALFSVATEDQEAVWRNLTGAVVLALLLTFLVPIRRAWKRRRYGP